MTKTVNIVRAFTLNLGDIPRDPDETEAHYVKRVADAGQRVFNIPAGIQQLPDVVANHWYTKANSVEGQLDPQAYAANLRAAADAQKIRAQEAQALADALDKQADEAEAEAKDAESKQDNPDPASKVTPPPETDAAPKAESDAEHTSRRQRST